MSKPKEPKKPFNPRVRANVYALAALYLVYLFYQIAKPYLTRDPYGPTSFQFTLGAVVLGGGAAVLGLLAWKMFKAPLPEDPEEPALPEEAGEDEEEVEKKRDP
ncbi:hypothetical protein [uncultured Oscillibacter sp.]|uniref:hypothetical protein n=1 Tax=uncultured Oscillibacter sp. TaxID=876091 RepID=UPI00261D9267|nr:hypothetical protein [uncultured Oscillibacter sp.]